MKKLILTTCFILFTFSVAIAWYPTGNWAKGECEICSKPVYSWVEKMDMYSGTPDWRSACPGSKVHTLTPYPVIGVCDECYEKYQGKLNTLIKKFVDEKREDNTELIKKHKKEEYQKKIDEREERIKVLEEELKELKGAGYLLLLKELTPNDEEMIVDKDELLKIDPSYNFIE